MIRWLFGVAPKIGSRWVYSEGRKDPFAVKPIVVVEAVKDGYVKHRGSWHNSSSIRMFRFIYRELKNG